MNKPFELRKIRFRRRILVCAIGAVLLAFFSVPILFILYSGAGAAIGGLMIIGGIAVMQLPVFMLLKWLGVLPKVDRDKSECQN